MGDGPAGFVLAAVRTEVRDGDHVAPSARAGPCWRVALCSRAPQKGTVRTGNSRPRPQDRRAVGYTNFGSHLPCFAHRGDYAEDTMSCPKETGISAALTVARPLVDSVAGRQGSRAQLREQLTPSQQVGHERRAADLGAAAEPTSVPRCTDMGCQAVPTPRVHVRLIGYSCRAWAAPSKQSFANQ